MGKPATVVTSVPLGQPCGLGATHRAGTPRLGITLGQKAGLGLR